MTWSRQGGEYVKRILHREAARPESQGNAWPLQIYER